MFDNAQITAVTGQALVTQRNANRDGTGDMEVILVSEFGLLVEMIVVKAVNLVANGMIRIFAYDPVSNANFLIAEFTVSVSTPSGEFETFSSTLIFPGNGYYLASEWVLKASTEYAENFNVFASAIKWTYL